MCELAVALLRMKVRTRFDVCQIYCKIKLAPFNGPHCIPINFIYTLISKVSIAYNHRILSFASTFIMSSAAHMGHKNVPLYFYDNFDK